MIPDTRVARRKRETESITASAYGSLGRAGPSESGLEFDWRHTFQVLLERKWVICGFVLSMLVASVLVLILYPPTYRATGLVQVQDDKQNDRPANVTGNQSISYDINGNSLEAEGEIEVLQSRMVLTEIISRLNLLIDAQPNTFPVIGGAIFRANAGSPVVVEVPDLLRHFAWGGEQIVVDKFEVPKSLQGEKYLIRATEGGYDLLDPYGQKVLEGAVGKPAHAGSVSIVVSSLKAAWGTTFVLRRYSLEDTLDSLADHLSVDEKVKGSAVIELAFKHKNPVVAAGVINNAEAIYLRRNNEWRSARAEELQNALRTQLPHLREQVEQAQKNLNAFQTQHGSVDVTQETQLLLQRGTELEAARLTLMQQREEAVQRFTPNHPMVVSIDDKLASIDNEMQKLKSQSTKLPATQQEVLNRTRDLDVANQLYTAMLNTIQQQEVIEAGTLGNVGGNIRILDEAFVPEKPWFPKAKILLPAGFLLGGMLGVAYVLIRQFWINPFHDVSELEARLGLTVLGRIPFSKVQRKLTSSIRRGKAEGKMLANAAPDDSAVESMRSLRSALNYATRKTTNNIIIISGPTAGIGKSFVAMNLAGLLALSGKRTVIIDADLGSGNLCGSLGLNSSPGLTDYILEAVPPGAVLQSTAIKDLTLISHGSRRTNAGELLMSDTFAGLLAYLSSRYDYVVIDTPGNLSTATAGMVGRLAGCTILVIKSGANSLQQIEESHRRLTQAGADVRGVVFNEI